MVANSNSSHRHDDAAGAASWFFVIAPSAVIVSLYVLFFYIEPLITTAGWEYYLLLVLSMFIIAPTIAMIEAYLLLSHNCLLGSLLAGIVCAELLSLCGLLPNIDHWIAILILSGVVYLIFLYHRFNTHIKEASYLNGGYPGYH